MTYTKENYSKAPVSFLLERLALFEEYIEKNKFYPYQLTYMPGSLIGFSSWQEEYAFLKNLFFCRESPIEKEENSCDIKDYIDAKFEDLYESLEKAFIVNDLTTEYLPPKNIP
jgi:hypothetical protein